MSTCCWVQHGLLRFQNIEIDGVCRTVLFLNNLQAEMMSRNEESLSKLVEHFARRSPKVVIHLCTSKGSREHVCEVENFDHKTNSAGFIPNHASFPSGKLLIECERDWLIRFNQGMTCLRQHFGKSAKIAVRMYGGGKSSLTKCEFLPTSSYLILKGEM